MFMAVYGVSPYAMPKDVALGCMMNLRMANAMHSLPVLMSVRLALGEKSAEHEFKSALTSKPPSAREQVEMMLESLKADRNRV